MPYQLNLLPDVNFTIFKDNSMLPTITHWSSQLVTTEVQINMFYNYYQQQEQTERGLLQKSL